MRISDWSSDVCSSDLPAALLADKGYDADAIRANLAERNTEAVIPGRSNRRVKIEHDRTLYKQRNRIERLFGQININRAIATRYDQLANSFLRTEKRRVGKEGGHTCRSGRAP